MVEAQSGKHHDSEVESLFRQNVLGRVALSAGRSDGDGVLLYQFPVLNPDYCRNPGRATLIDRPLGPTYIAVRRRYL